ncbi:MAG: P-loop NTPase [Pirellulaceae bacterium]|jgi:Mrp family chromosome partitioning ATPase|nr:P-loop NTPase [Pirellulaceae bacterium]MDP7016089.1 P-loop NTPase [Pirellulaceae bacterium]
MSSIDEAVLRAFGKLDRSATQSATPRKSTKAVLESLVVREVDHDGQAHRMERPLVDDGAAAIPAPHVGFPTDAASVIVLGPAVDAGADYIVMPDQSAANISPSALQAETFDFSSHRPAPIQPTSDVGHEERSVLPMVADREDDEGSAPPTTKPAPDQPAEPAEFIAAWEVDQLVWPELADELYLTQEDQFRQAGEELTAASQEGLTTLGVFSAHSGEGRTTFCINLARAAAAGGARVALIDCDINNPALGAALQIDLPHGWDEILRERLPISEAAITSIDDSICVFPLTERASADEVSLANRSVQELIGRISEHFDLVIIDAGAALDGDSHLDSGDALALDAAIAVCDVRSTSQPELAAVVQTLRNAGVHAVGLAENFSG